jgi:hypothetical protein
MELNGSCFRAHNPQVVGSNPTGPIGLNSAGLGCCGDICGDSGQGTAYFTFRSRTGLPTSGLYARLVKHMMAPAIDSTRVDA